MNCLLYEKSTGPDLELIAATTRQVKPCGSDDEDMNLSGKKTKAGTCLLYFGCLYILTLDTIQEIITIEEVHPEVPPILRTTHEAPDLGPPPGAAAARPQFSRPLLPVDLTGSVRRKTTIPAQVGMVTGLRGTTDTWSS